MNGRSIFGWLLLALFAVRASAQQTTPPSSGKAFATEAAGGVVGSALGYGIVFAATRNCSDPDDLVRCTLGPAAVAVTSGTVLSVVGVVVAGRANDTRPSTTGAVVGSIAGAVAGIGLEHLLREEMGLRLGRVGSFATVTITQGVLTAAASRLLSEARR